MQGYTCIRFFMEILPAEVRRMVLKKKSGGSEGIAYILLRFSLPLILSGVLQQLYNWADAFIVGNVVGELALAAVSPGDCGGFSTSRPAPHHSGYGAAGGELFEDYICGHPFSCCV